MEKIYLEFMCIVLSYIISNNTGDNEDARKLLSEIVHSKQDKK